MIRGISSCWKNFGTIIEKEARQVNAHVSMTNTVRQKTTAFRVDMIHIATGSLQQTFGEKKALTIQPFLQEVVYGFEWCITLDIF